MTDAVRGTGGNTSRGRILKTLAGVAVSIGLLVLAFRGVPLSAALEQAKSANLWWLAVAVTVATSTFLLRVFRWQLLLRREDGGRIPAMPLWHAVAMGFMGNNLLPFRAGELLRAYAAVRLAKTRFSTTISSIAAERIFDGLGVVAGFAVALLLPGLPHNMVIAGQPVSRVATTATVLCIGLLAAAGVVVAAPVFAERMVRALVPSPRLADRLVGLIEGIRQGLTVLRSPARLAGVIGWTIVLWTVNAAGFWLGFKAFGIEVNFAGALILQAVLVFGIAVPSTPGFVGVFEFVVRAVLALYGVADDRAVAYAVVFHVATFIPITGLGLWSLWKTPVALGDFRNEARAAE